MQATKEQYLAILHQFVDENAFQPICNAPFTINSKSFATDAHIMVVTPEMDEIKKGPEFEKNIERVYPVIPNIDIAIQLNALKETLNEIPLIDSYDEREEEQECDACDGSGYVDFEFEHDCKTYDIEGNCPVCEGDGITTKTKKVPNGKKEPNPEYLIQIGNSYFGVPRIKQLLFVAETLQSDLKMTYQDQPNDKSFFVVKDVEVLLMPTIRSETDKFIIELKANS